MYSYIYSQGPDVTCRREISTTIAIESIPSVMRAIGFYPSELEVLSSNHMLEDIFLQFIISCISAIINSGGHLHFTCPYMCS